jgi:hypothetical protein
MLHRPTVRFVRPIRSSAQAMAHKFSRHRALNADLSQLRTAIQASGLPQRESFSALLTCARVYALTLERCMSHLEQLIGEWLQYLAYYP